MRRAALGSLSAVAATIAVTAALLPLRSSISTATVALVLVVPVVLGVVTGGVRAGVVAVIAGFLAYDFVFILPYYTLSVGAGQNWAALGVYVVVMLVVARVVSRLQEARSEAQRRATAAQRLLELSQLLVTDRATPDTYQATVDAIRSALRADGVALLVPGPNGLDVTAVSGEPPSESDLADLRSQSGIPVAIGIPGTQPTALRAVPLVTAGRPVGVLALRGAPAAGVDHDLLQIFVNQVALTVERGALREQVVRSRILEEGDRLRRALLGAVSHDLRTPLAAMKIASTSLLYSDEDLDDDSRRELYELLDGQADRLGRLVTGLLDMNRYQSGALRLERQTFPLAALVDEAVATLGPAALDGREVEVHVEGPVAAVHADRILLGQVIMNLLDNAVRHGPPGLPVRVVAQVQDGEVKVAVEDSGPGVPPGEHEAVFERFFRSGSGGRAGLGLWISRTFVEAHGGRIWVEDARPGARFCFTLPAADRREGAA